MDYEKLQDPQTKVIISTSPTGLGHIRVTKALIDGLIDKKKPEIIGISDTTIALMYRIISTNYFLRRIFEFGQNDPLTEKILTDLMRMYQQSHIKSTINEITRIIENDGEIKQIVFVSTHPMIGSKIQKIIEKKIFDIPTFHTVIVTDDSPQRFWMVPSDCIFVPSNQTKDKLETLCKENNINCKEILVAPYPINPKYRTELEPHVLFNKQEQLDPDNPQRARICIPISGAAVQLDFYMSVVQELIDPQDIQDYREFTFSVITREGNFTTPFINYFRHNDQVVFHIGANDLQTVELYDELYEQLNPPSLEITKPSEQCFKVLTGPQTMGGPIILLTDPVGRQEQDNLKYLERFGFMPNMQVHEILYKEMRTDRKSSIISLLEQAPHWRALKLPSDPIYAAQFIRGCFSNGIFQAMQNYKKYTETNELSPNGVETIWSTINAMIQ
jgi:hypothetical protein